MANLFGFEVNTPAVDLTGFLSSTWIYVLVIGFIGFLFVSGIAFIIFWFTWNRKIELYENISGRGYVRIRTALARRIKLGRAGEEILRTMGGDLFSAYGRKIARNTYAFAKGEDGYWYNFIHGDLDAKFGILDIEPIDKDVRMFHIGINKIADKEYGERKSFLEKWGIHMIFVILIVAVLIGFYLISGKLAEGIAASNSPEAAEINKETAELLNQLGTKLDLIARNLKNFETPQGQGGSGLVPAVNITGG